MSGKQRNRKPYRVQQLLSEEEMRRMKALVLGALAIVAKSSPTGMIGILTLSKLLAQMSGHSAEAVELAIWYFNNRGLITRRSSFVGLKQTKNDAQPGQAPFLCRSESEVAELSAA